MTLLAGFFLVLTLAASLDAGPVHVWAIGEIENSPLLVVGTVERIEKREPVPSGRWRSRLPEQYWEASIKVHRYYSHRAAAPRSGSHITVRYVSCGDTETGGFSGLPVWPRFETGDTALFPLSPDAGGRWLLVADEGENLTVPAIVRKWQKGGASYRNGRAFILTELANALACGDARTRYASAVYLRQRQGWPDGFQAILQAAVGENEDRWLEVACALLASVGVPHTGIADLLANATLPGPQNQAAAAWALAKTVTRDHPTHLIRCLLRNMPAYDWGAANWLLEFKDAPLVTQHMRRSLARDPSGSIYVAWTLIRNGQHAFLREALQAAVKLVSSPEPVPVSRLQAASSLLYDHGTDQQFDAIPSTLRRLKHENEDTYRKLFGSATHTNSSRELRIAAVAIDDCRPGFRTLRYCDVAAARVQQLSGESFGIKQDMTPDERDRAVALASAWLQSHRDQL